MQNSKPILLVEDDEVHTMKVKRAFKELEVTNPLNCAGDGEEALEFLRDESNKKPGVILLDLNMPRMNGFEFLKITKSDGVLKEIPTVVLTTSSEKRDITRSFRFGVAGYIVKPVDYKQFIDAIRTIGGYWTLSELPNGG